MSIQDKSISDQTRKELGQPLDEFLVSCSINAVPCSEEDFDWYFDGVFGNCYTFNKNQVWNPIINIFSSKMINFN